uniref:Uncharacterized protein n=1 Tax=Musa acuminata subsp. malaccensis TaxID=214687 RepID=A0A804IJ01_MUSAM
MLVRTTTPTTKLAGDETTENVRDQNPPIPDAEGDDETGCGRPTFQ